MKVTTTRIINCDLIFVLFLNSFSCFSEYKQVRPPPKEVQKVWAGMVARGWTVEMEICAVVLIQVDDVKSL